MIYSKDMSEDLTKQLPCLATMGNAVAGLAACGLALTGKPDLGAILILVAVLMDSFDGALARSLDAASEFGAQLDSMADLISFGVAPAVVVGAVLPEDVRYLGWALLVVYPLCAMWRLARFNVQHGDPDAPHGDFAGLPTTGAGAAVATAVLMLTRLNESAMQAHPVLLAGLMAMLGLFMVSHMTYRHMGSLLSHVPPTLRLLVVAFIVAASFVWPYEYILGGIVWAYVLSGPLGFARERIHATVDNR